ncbi:MAG: hypothetical protein MO852_15905 [Candidatus Devosia euplotis]|nr:hypothetical protein [Candidatus Devosia euplotis]
MSKGAFMRLSSARKSAMCVLATTVLLIPAVGIGEETVIHRCTQDDGTIAFQETPCAEVAEDNDSEAKHPPAGEIRVAADSHVDFVNPFDAEDAPLIRIEEDRSPPSRDRADCEKSTRDAIDAIDAKLQNSTSPASDREHLEELLQLTRQLRACKQL